MGHNWSVVLFSAECSGLWCYAAGSGATVSPPSPDESLATSKKHPVHETRFYLRVFKVNLNQENYT